MVLCIWQQVNIMTVLPARIFRNPKIIVEISQNWDPNPKVSQTESQGTSQGFIKTPKRIITFIWQRFRYKSGIIFTTLMLYDASIASQPPKVTNLWQCLHEISTWRAVSEASVKHFLHWHVKNIRELNQLHCHKSCHFSTHLATRHR